MGYFPALSALTRLTLPTLFEFIFTQNGSFFGAEGGGGEKQSACSGNFTVNLTDNEVSSVFFPFSFQGDWVWLKKFPPGDFGDIKSIKSSASDVFEMV